MFLRRLEFKNIGSFGDILYTLEFTRDGEMIQLKGLSGAGKSTVLSLPSLLYYGKLIGTNKTSIANRSNKNGYIKGYTLAGSKEYIIERGFSPNFLNIYENVDGELRDVQNIGSLDGQTFIEENIIGMSQKMFNSLISLNLNNFKSFIMMNPNEKKQIIDNLFELDIVNSVHQAIRESSRDLNQVILKHNAACEALLASIENAKNQITRIQESNQRITDSQDNFLTDSQIRELTLSLDSLKSESLEADKLYEQVRQEHESLRSKDVLFSKAYNTLSVQKTKLNHDKKHVESQLGLFSKSKCPTCSADFSSDYFTNIKDELEKSYSDIQSKLNDIAQQEINYNNNVAKYNEMLSSVSSRVEQSRISSNKIKTEMNRISETISHDLRLKNNFKLADPAPLYEMIKKTETDIDALKSEISGNNVELMQYSILETVYSDNGVKKDIIGSFVPKINAEIQRSLVHFSFPYLLEFDNQFIAHLYHLGEEIPISTLSAGELKRTDIAVLCALLSIVKQKYKDINFISFDETLSSIDMQTADDIVKYLDQFSQDNKLSIIIVNHAPLNNEYIDKIISVVKTGLFSEMTIEDCAI